MFGLLEYLYLLHIFGIGAGVNFRGCSGEVNQQPGAYHLGFTNDLKLLLTEMVQKQTSTKPVYLSAFSLGANVVVKVLGELGTAAKVSRYICLHPTEKV